MRFFEELDNSGFFVNTSTVNSPYSELQLLEQESGFLGVPGKAYYKLCWYDNYKNYKCFVIQEEGNFIFDTCNSFYFKVSNEITTILQNVQKLYRLYTEESVKRELSKYPTLRKFTDEHIFSDFDWKIGNGFVWKTKKIGRKKFKSGIGLEIAKSFSAEIESLFVELDRLEINTENLEKFKPIVDLSQINVPSWIKKAAIVGGIIVLKVAVKSIGQDVDIDITTEDTDGDINISDNSDINSYESNSIPDDNYNYISFGKAPNDGTYSETGQTVSVRSDSGNMYNNVSVYLHHGKKYIDFKNHWFEMSGSGFFSFLGNGYKILH